MDDSMFTIPGVYSVGIGDVVTFGGLFALIPNPDRRWFQFWKPKLVKSRRLQRFVVVEEYRG